MNPVTAILYTYLLTGLFLGVMVAGVLDSKVKMPGKIERDLVEMERQMETRGVTRELMLIMLVLFWPVLFGGTKK